MTDRLRSPTERSALPQRVYQQGNPLSEDLGDRQGEPWQDVLATEHVTLLAWIIHG
jgi:hypothetical protein